MPEFSVIVPTFDRRDAVLRCLDALERQSLPPDRFEVLIADDGSRDGTREAVEARALTVPFALRVIACEHGGPATARNAAAALARGEWLAFTDSDAAAEPEWLERARARCDAGAEALAGDIAPTVGGSFRALDDRSSPIVSAANLFVRRAAFERLGGFDESYRELRWGIYFREDADLGFRLLESGARIEAAHNAVVRHAPSFSTTASCFAHARRYYLDSLLYRRHPRAYRSLIERKRIGPLTISRPAHYLSLLYTLVLTMLAACLARRAFGAALALAAAAFALQGPVLYRYQRRMWMDLARPARALALTVLPPHYLYWLIRGCLRHRTLGPLL